MKNIQVTISVIFGLIIVIGVFVFAGIIPSPKTVQEQQKIGKIAIWGTIDENIMTELILQKITAQYPNLSVKYSQHPNDTFANDLIEALASGTGPDMVLLPEDLIVRFSGKIEPFAPTFYPERTFRDTFIEEGELFISQRLGILALPFTIDPMVMYWNRNMFSAGNIARPPEYWDEFLTLAPILSKRNDANEVQKSAIAFGEFRNVTHAKDILAMLMIQSGNPITVLDDTGVSPVMSGIPQKNIPPADEAVRFYTDFSDPEKSVYSWNRSLPESKNAFLSQDLAVYFGYSSELLDIQKKNPNLNFDVAPMPQVRDLPYKSTFGKMTGVAVMKTSPNKPVAFFTTQILISPEFHQEISKALHLPLAQRALLAKTPDNPFMKVFYDSALISRSWLDVNPSKTYRVFETAIDSVIAGKVRIRGAVERAQDELLLSR